MSTKSPLQQVREAHGSKADLAAKVLKFLDRPEDEDGDTFEARVNSMSNRKLLRLWQANETLTGTHGSRESLVDKITVAQFPGGNAPYADKIGGYSTPRLLDLARQHKV
jgi:hypothetical protein